MNLRHSVVAWPLRRAGCATPAVFARLADMGFTALEMARPDEWAAAQSAGLRLLNVAAPREAAGLGSVAEHPHVLAAIRETIHRAADAAIGNVVVFSGERCGVSDSAGAEACVRGLDALAAESADARVVLLLEILGTPDHPDYLAARSRFVFDVVARVDADSVRALYDVYHAKRMGEDPVADLRAHAPLVGHVHVAGAPGRRAPHVPQDIDYGAVVGAALGAGYDGWWGQEFILGGDPFRELGDARRSFERYADASAAARGRTA